MINPLFGQIRISQIQPGFAFASKAGDQHLDKGIEGPNVVYVVRQVTGEPYPDPGVDGRGACIRLPYVADVYLKAEKGNGYVKVFNDMKMPVSFRPERINNAYDPVSVKMNSTGERLFIQA